MELSGRIVITFDDVLPGEKPLSLDEYLDGISKEMLIKFSSFILGFSRNSEFENPSAFLRMYFSKENKDFANEVFENLSSFAKESEYGIATYSFPYIVSSLSFFEYAHDKDYGETKSFSNPEMEIKIFKAYLLLNKFNTTDRTPILNESTKHLKGEISKYPVAYIIGLLLNNSDFSNYEIRKVFVTQTIRAISFFEFLAKTPEAHELLEAFFNEYGISSYQDYIRGLLPIKISVLYKDKEAHTDIVIPDGEHKMESIAFLEKFSIPESQLLGDFDFKNLRSTPIYRVDENTFRLTYPLFVLELIGNGLYFKFKAINDQLPKDEKVTNLYGLKTYEFSEKYILHTLLKEYYGNRYFQKTGDELDANYDAAPDYYVRNGKRIFMFESKDILINAAVKQSSDFNVIDRELSLKLLQNEKGKPKAVLQLINNVRKILSGTLEFDSGFNPKNAIVHPILVLHYRIFNTAGLNKWVNFWFREELAKLSKEGFDTSNIRPLVLIDIDTLIYNKDVFKHKKLSFEDVLIDYQDNYIDFSVRGRKYNSREAAIQAQKNSLIPFGEFLDALVDSKGMRSVPEEFIEKAYSMFD
nr:hypothetical protein [Allomuricauda sp.]